MPTPVWDSIHLEFASSIRDGVSTASVDGKELTVSDRDSYLNYGYRKFVSLIAIHFVDAIDEYVPELFKSIIVIATAGVIPYPDDFGYFIDIQSPIAGTVVSEIPAHEYLTTKRTSTL